LSESFARWLLCGRGVGHFDEELVQSDDIVERGG
jgi:hypothetical protein